MIPTNKNTSVSHEYYTKPQTVCTECSTDDLILVFPNALQNNPKPTTANNPDV